MYDDCTIVDMTINLERFRSALQFELLAGGPVACEGCAPTTTTTLSRRRYSPYPRAFLHRAAAEFYLSFLLVL